MTHVAAIAVVGLAASLALALWRLVEEVRTTSRLRLELRGVIDHARKATSNLKQEQERTIGYQAIVRKLKEGIDRKNALLEKHNVSPSVVIDDVLSKGSGET
jgi:predicted amino acid dehydrogenase